MPRLIPDNAENGRFALVEADGTVVGHGHLELPFVPAGAGGALLTDVRFVLEPRAEDRTNEKLMLEAHSA